MKIQDRLVSLAMAATLACLIAMAWVTPLLADADEGDGLEADDLLLPIVIGAVIVVGAIALWRSRRPRGSGAE